MGQYKTEGDPEAALAEECSEVIKVITKKIRFSGDWNEIPPGGVLSRWQDLELEMEDLIFQWKRLKTERGKRIVT